jgi:[glutamine synthetase] adenylyltransferase / [glutamine synthetase]-adenylyl-L-tyrosine phosphorylase
MVDMPSLLQAQADKHWSRFEEGAAEVVASLSEPRRAQLHTLFACSDFAADSLCRQPELALELDDARDLHAGASCC